jgi:hypothetical protein
VSCLVAVGFVALGSGIFFELAGLPSFRVEGLGIRVFKHPNVGNATRYVCEHLREGDVVLTTHPFQVRHLMRGHVPADVEIFWPATQLQLPATLDDKRALPLDRRDGSPQIPDFESLREVFNRHERVWFIVDPTRSQAYNVEEVNPFFLENMDVVYEDFRTLVLFRGGHRAAETRRKSFAELSKARASYLP